MIIIPARLKSTRFPQKMLADIAGVPLIVRTAQNAAKVDDVVVACDDMILFEVCQKHKVKVIMTSTEHQSGTDRCAEAYKKLGLSKDEIILNIQGDEPFLEKEVIVKLQETLKKSDFMASLAKKITKEEARDSNLVKVVLSNDKKAIYFSRSIIPYNRDNIDFTGYLGHLGVYGFFGWSLEEFCILQKTQLEEIEKLEQLRAIFHQKTIMMDVVETKSIGIDTQEDLKKALALHNE
ncbi:3-deoxy-manno-octulosonate cytidylyltransferase [Helicobacter anatolicus]|uniref:3-deoxy-manno-octulosonate cytidylyltransferase n=1 Tax=Helicobacter anatolicus TaxID=2905874 RepID=UPI001E36BF81|nr:3-deoxy-manno-octulosonate cytidylyltransferase [Helicobacter anatolicus]MCE3038838.1 3-deoxy-manno-octulosonate cytidylyltransferase [Helicobacter anatolicus]